ncbi:MAG: hypothetical protein L0220_05445 [Acidobacteria bacterium]|nr:hypothetical protein [Acidobacteriota bacterium]
MSDTYLLYVVDEEKLPKALPGLSELEKYEKLVARIEEVGSQWEMISLDFLPLAEALESIDQLVTGGTDLIPTFAFAYSPHNLLDPNNDDYPDLGYFKPVVVKDLNDSYQSISEAEVERFLKKRERYVETVYYAFESAIREAAKRGYAVAVLSR